MVVAQVPLAAEVPVAQDTPDSSKETTADASTKTEETLETSTKPGEQSSETADMTASPTAAVSEEPSEPVLTEIIVSKESSVVDTTSPDKPSQEESVVTSVSDSVPSEKILPASQTAAAETSIAAETGAQVASNDTMKSNSADSQAGFSREAASGNQPYSPPPSSSIIPTIIPHESKGVPALTSSGESIFRTIMTRLTALETNSTLILRYVEEQTRSLRDALRRLEEDVGRLEGLVSTSIHKYVQILSVK